MKRFVCLLAGLCVVQTCASAQEPEPQKAAEAAYEYLHSPARDKEIEWLKRGDIKTSSTPDEAALDTVRSELTSEFEVLLKEQRELTGTMQDQAFFALESLTSQSLVTDRYETVRRYIDVMKKNTLEGWQGSVARRLDRSGASEESKRRFLQNFMAGMESSFAERLVAMGYTDKESFDRDTEQSERELLWWQEIFKMLQDTYGRWRFDPTQKRIVFKAEIENSQFKRLLSKVAPE
jgi:hypothetical protein